MSTQTPAVGMEATYIIGSDCYPYKVVEVSPSGHKVVMRAMKAVCVREGGVSGPPQYRYEDYPSGAGMRWMHATRRKHGVSYIYRPQGRRAGLVTFGRARFYSDPSF